MAKQEQETEVFFGGFEAITGGLTKHTSGGNSRLPDGTDSPVDLSKKRVSGDNDDYPIVDPKNVMGQGQDDDDDEPIEDIEEVDEIEEEEEIEDTEEITDEITDLDLGEAEESDIVTFLSGKLTESLGWGFPEGEEPKTVNEIVEYMKDVVAENSAPNYASEEIQKLNDYVSNGGNLKNFLKEVYGNIDLDGIDIDNHSNQKAVVTQNLERLGYSKARIAKLIDRYEEAGTLEEEAEDALEVLKDYNQRNSETLLENAKKDRIELQERQQKFFTDVQTSIEKLGSVRGIPISSSEKKQLVEYLFKPEGDGTTKYQKDYAKDYKNLIESAYFTMKGDSLINKVTLKATSQAARNLQEKLAKKGKRAKNSGTQGVGNQNSLNAWDTVSSQLRRPNNNN